MYQSLVSHELFLCIDGSYRALNGGFIIDFSSLDIQVGD